ncbi:MAG: hypothetical protein RLZZ271_1137 [Pseudomonadota bacterium]|jgi:predicted esterase YcpF (UPF0227 family)
MPLTHLLYLHGFRSSPNSFKAQLMASWMREHRPDVAWCCPQLPASPREAVELIESCIAHWPRETMAVIGSSLGGFYAHIVAERCGCPAVLINPAVHPARDLAKYIGEHPAWHNPAEKIFFRPEYVDELKALEGLPVSQPQRIMSIIAQGDEVLDWCEMAARFAGTQMRLLEGGDHALSDFEHAHLRGVLDFLGLHPAA